MNWETEVVKGKTVKQERQIGGQFGHIWTYLEISSDPNK